MTNSTLPTTNEDWGFFGTAAGFTDADKAWEIAFPEIAKVTMGSAEGVRDFLDSRHGRHFADDVHNGIHAGLKAHRSAGGAKGARGPMPLGSRVAAGRRRSTPLSMSSGDHFASS